MSILSIKPGERAVISMLDLRGREINYMRVSVTDKCNLRCRYCMPEGVDIVPMSDLLTLEEIREVCRQASLLGIDRIKITGGEPLVRKGVTDLVSMLRELPDIRQITMTSNGVLLSQYLPDLVKAGLDGINISLDTLDRENYERITGRDYLDEVLKGLDQALDSGIRVKMNSVLMKGLNDQEWLDLISMARTKKLDVRMIEMMPIGSGKSYEGISNQELLRHLKEHFPDLMEDHRVHGNGPAVYYQIPGWKGSIGLISPVHGKFCDSCNRIRMSAMGDLKPCLCFAPGANIRDVLRNQGEEAVAELLRKVISEKPEAHCFGKIEEITEDKQMIAIGG